MKAGSGWWLGAAGTILAVLGAVLVWRSLPGGPLPAGDAPGSVVMEDGAPLPQFVLRGPQGKFGNADLLGKWTFLFFGYTQCPDICPTALSLMKEAQAILGGAGAVPPAPTFRVVFVSVDPRRDSIELLRQYMAAFDPSFIGVSGEDGALTPLTSKLGVYYRRNDATDQKNYTVDHSAAIHLIDPRGHLAAVFPAPQDARTLVAEFRRIALR